MTKKIKKRIIKVLLTGIIYLSLSLL